MCFFTCNVQTHQKTINSCESDFFRCIISSGRVLQMWLIASENDDRAITTCLDKAMKNGMAGVDCFLFFLSYTETFIKTEG